ncbi:MAG: monovalent cation/H(+) antiporter subunit G [Gammaproteobacteria bacterium]|nr:monovalent cation/H(+) antiporter subunit G [Gammaproteobacteria bacterium]
MIVDIASMLLIVTGMFFFVAGTLGLLRFPDVYTRLHALTKADNVGLGFVVCGLCLQTNSLSTVGLLIFIWLLVMLSGASASQLVAQAASHSPDSDSPGDKVKK